MAAWTGKGYGLSEADVLMSAFLDDRHNGSRQRSSSSKLYIALDASASTCTHVQRGRVFRPSGREQLKRRNDLVCRAMSKLQLAQQGTITHPLTLRLLSSSILLFPED